METSKSDGSGKSPKESLTHLEDVYENWDLNLYVPFGLQFRAVFLKNVTLAVRQRKSLIFCCITSIILMLIPIFVNRLAPVRYYSNWSPFPEFPEPQEDSYPSDWLLGNSSKLYDSSPEVYYWNVLVEDSAAAAFGDQPMEPPTWQEQTSGHNENLYKGLMGQLAQKWVHRNSTYLRYSSYCTEVIGTPIYVNDSSGYYQDYDYMPYYLNYNMSTMFFRHFNATESLEEAFLQYSNYSYCGTSPIALHVHAASVDLQQPLSLYATQLTPYSGSSYTSYYYQDAIFLMRAAMLGTAMQYRYSQEELSNETQNATPFMYSGTYRLANNVRAGKATVINGFGITFYWLFSLISMSLILPILMQRVVVERSEGLVDLSKMMGLRRRVYWSANLCLDYGLYIFVLIILFIVAGASSSTLAIIMISPWVFFPLLIFGFTMSFEAYFITFFFRRLRPATTFAYVFSLAQVGVAALFNLVLLQPFDHQAGYLVWWPPFAFYRVTYLGFLFHSTNDSFIRHSLTPVLRDSFLCLIFETAILVGIVLALDRWGPSKLGNRGTIWDLLTDFISNKWRNCSNKGARNSSESDSEDQVELKHMDNPLLVAEEDARVAQERNAVLNGLIENPIMLVKNVTKVYAEGTKSFTALGGISIGLKAGDCFGLLGPNGAGKSTLVAMMSGISRPTSGSIRIERSDTRCAIGLCPQDDIFYEDLSVEEHLLYYARLKGKGPGDDLESVDRILADTSMLEERRKYAGNLSGGQKRRLSVASALCGDPMVIFLDEPSSSLDPASRLALWEIIQSISQTRCTLITTHSMEEAEVLCNRIGIIKDGMMVCLGTPSQLKKDYGRGYKLVVSMMHGRSIDPVMEQVLKVAPSASVLSHRRGTFEIQLGSGKVLLSKVSEVIEGRQSRLGIECWSLSRNGLDEVFLRIVEERSVKKRRKDGTLAPKTGGNGGFEDEDDDENDEEQDEEELPLGEDAV